MKLIISPRQGKAGTTYVVDFTINSITPPYPLAKALPYIGKVNGYLKLTGNYEVKVEANLEKAKK